LLFCRFFSNADWRPAGACDGFFSHLQKRRLSCPLQRVVLGCRCHHHYHHCPFFFFLPASASSPLCFFTSCSLPLYPSPLSVLSLMSSSTPQPVLLPHFAIEMACRCFIFCTRFPFVLLHTFLFSFLKDAAVSAHCHSAPFCPLAFRSLMLWLSRLISLLFRFFFVKESIRKLTHEPRYRLWLFFAGGRNASAGVPG